MTAPAPGPVAIGEAPHLVAFGKYLLLDRIATGGMAEVWLGKTIHEGGASDLIAIKRLLSRYSDDHEFLTMFVDEARIAGQLQHPGIAPIHELGRVGSSMYIAMEFVWGRDLLGILRRLRELGRGFDGTTTAYIGARIAEALHYAHTKTDKDGEPLHVVHRDVSPQNVLVSFDGKVKLIDFGIAKAASRSTKTQAGTLKGKVGYMSPEQVRGAAVDHRSDQFALGTCLYEMLTGRPLFSRANNYEAMELVREAEVPQLATVAPDCPARLAEIIMKSIAKDPDARYATSHELQKALSLFLADADPGYERFSLVTWLRSIFKDEMVEEKRRLDAMDLIGRPALAALGKRRVSSSTRLEIGAHDLYDDDDDAETQIFEESPLSRLEIDVRPEGPYEVFFQRDELVRVGDSPAVANVRPLKATFRPGRSQAAESWRPPRTDLAEMGPYKRPAGARDTDPEARKTPVSGATATSTDRASSPDRPTPERATMPDRAVLPEGAALPSVLLSGELEAILAGAGVNADVTQRQESMHDDSSDPERRITIAENLAMDPAELNSQVIRALLPTGKTDPAVKKAGAREPTESVRHDKREASTRRRALAQDPERKRPRRSRRGDLVFFAIAAFFMLAVGAGGTYWWLTNAATSSIEIRTTPPIAATVLIDGAPRGRTPVRIDGLAPGRHAVSLVAEGFETTTREVQLAPRTTAMLELQMAGTPPPPRPGDSPRP